MLDRVTLREAMILHEMGIELYRALFIRYLIQTGQLNDE